jgi:radical SAM-linked protein
MAVDGEQRVYALVTWRKAGALRWLGHLDIARTFDRAVRRARLPVVYSEGFSPSAAISFADALALGVGGENELCLIRLERPMGAEALAEMLAEQMPEQLEIVGARVLPHGQGKPFSRLSRAEYEIELWPVPGVSVETFKEAVRRVRQAGALPVSRETKSRVREIDIKPHLHALHLTEPGADHPGVRLQMSLGYGQERLVKPPEVLSCIAQQLTELTGEQIALQPRLTTRLGLY